MKKENSINWWSHGIQNGWIEIYEEELIRFLEAEFGELSDHEKLFTVFSSLFIKSGNTCLPVNLSPGEWAAICDLDDQIRNMLPDQPLDIEIFQKSVLTGNSEIIRPFILDGKMLSIRRYWNMEMRLSKWLLQKSSRHNNILVTDIHRNELNRLFPVNSNETDWQKIAAALSLIKPFLIISGGPGTGKTTTVAKILALHQRLARQPLNIALAAPTGKAAGRMGEALFGQLKQLGISENELQKISGEAKTIHRLLSGIRERGLLPPVEKKTLPYDLVIIDEASMIDLTLMHNLVEHLSDKTTLILLGDKDQLASVEAGSVFSDLCRKPENGFLESTQKQLQQFGFSKKLSVQNLTSLDDSIVYLTKSYRFHSESGIGRLANIVKNRVHNEDKIRKYFSDYLDLDYGSFSYEEKDFQNLFNHLKGKVKIAQNITDPEDLFAHWKEEAWLAVLKRGLTGTETLNSLTEKTLVGERIVKLENGWYHGRPVIITRNDYNLGIFNGDLGICVQSSVGELRVFVDSGAELRKFIPAQIVHYQPAYFLT
ncbi:MAG: exodeoxyribonuclease V subunit alpha, partial [Balneolaceae bacterium]